MNDIAWNTIAGAVYASAELEPYFPPTNEERNRLNAHTFRIGLPVDLWEEWLARVDARHASELKSYDALFGLWLLMVRWQVERGIDQRPTCAIGAGVYDSVEKSIKILLTSNRVAL